MTEKFLSVFPLLLAVTFSGVSTSHGSTIVEAETRGKVCLTPYGEVADGKSFHRKGICEKIECDAMQSLIYNWTCPTPPTYPNKYCFYLSTSSEEYPECCKVALACT
ncbi:unnamed protein product [Ixodes persulcatus]